MDVTNSIEVLKSCSRAIQSAIVALEAGDSTNAEAFIAQVRRTLERVELTPTTPWAKPRPKPRVPLPPIPTHPYYSRVKKEDK